MHPWPGPCIPPGRGSSPEELEWLQRPPDCEELWDQGRLSPSFSCVATRAEAGGGSDEQLPEEVVTVRAGRGVIVTTSRKKERATEDHGARRIRNAGVTLP